MLISASCAVKKSPFVIFFCNVRRSKKIDTICMKYKGDEYCDVASQFLYISPYKESNRYFSKITNNT